MAAPASSTHAATQAAAVLIDDTISFSLCRGSPGHMLGHGLPSAYDTHVKVGRPRSAAEMIAEMATVHTAASRHGRLVPAIHVFPAMRPDVDARHKAGHDRTELALLLPYV